MKSKNFRRYYLIALLCVLIVSFYPLYMGVNVIWDMIADGTVMKENYPKYIIPYTPIAVAVLVGVSVMPILFKRCKRFSLPLGSLLAMIAFFALEILFENKVIVTSADVEVKLEHWQMAMCAYVPEATTQTIYRTQTPVDILMGNYSPAFKLHFYMISILLVLTILNCVYGFGQMIVSGDKKRKKPLILQSIATAIFLGLCILACFTAFWRDGNLQVSALSASLMILFFVLLGIVGGIYTGSFLIGKRKVLSVLLPGICAVVLTALMYVGEMILLNGHVYKLGNGFLFDSIPGLLLAPADLLVILASGGITALIFQKLNKKTT